VVETTDTPEIRWPVPRAPRLDEADDPQDTRLPTRRIQREQRGARLRWGLLWLSALVGGITAWVWLARQDRIKTNYVAAERELNEIMLLRTDLERVPELRAATLRIYVEKVEARRDALSKRIDSLPSDCGLRQNWATELAALKEAKADLEWIQPRWLQLGVMEGAKLTDEIKANEAALRPKLDQSAARQEGSRFRPGLARGLLVELDRRMNDVRAAAAAAAAPPMPMDEPLVLKTEEKKQPKLAVAKRPAAKAPVKLAMKPTSKPVVKPGVKPLKRFAILAKNRPQRSRDLAHRNVRIAARDDSGEEIIRATRRLRQGR
jgi:hypothetical protein